MRVSLVERTTVEELRLEGRGLAVSWARARGARTVLGIKVGLVVVGAKGGLGRMTWAHGITGTVTVGW